MVTLSLLSSGLIACHRSTRAQRYELKGEVVSVDQRLKKVTIAHEEIPGYMAPMTMPFTVKEEWAYGVLGAGDQVVATLVVDGERSWLEDLVVTQEGVPESTEVVDTASDPQPGTEVPDFPLMNQGGRRISLRQFRGQALVLTFIFTRCPLPDYCPLMSRNFEELQKALEMVPTLASKTRLLSITIDPDYDTPAVLRRYGETYTRNFEAWQFATGTPDELRAVAYYFGLRYWSEDNQLVHTLRTAIIDGDGRLVKLYRGNEWKAEEVLRDLNNLKGD